MPAAPMKLPIELVEPTRRTVVEAMEAAPAGFAVPLKVEIKAGRTWATPRGDCCCGSHPGTARMHRRCWRQQSRRQRVAVNGSLRQRGMEGQDCRG